MGHYTCPVRSPGMPELYGLTNCDSCRAARKWLAGKGLRVAFIDLRQTPPAPALLARWISETGWESLLNRRSKTWRELPAVQREHLDARRASALLRAHPLLIKRPVLVSDGQVYIGFSAARYSEIFAVP